jgi:hypothetical protein
MRAGLLSHDTTEGTRLKSCSSGNDMDRVDANILSHPMIEVERLRPKHRHPLVTAEDNIDKLYL